jgi:hypothetical protein
LRLSPQPGKPPAPRPSPTPTAAPAPWPCLQAHAWLQLAQHSTSPLDQLAARQAAAEAAAALPPPARAELALEYASWLHGTGQAEPGQAEQMLLGAAALLLGDRAPGAAAASLTVEEAELLVRLFVAAAAAAPGPQVSEDHLMAAQHHAVALLVALVTLANARAALAGRCGAVETPGSLPAWAAFDPDSLAAAVAEGMAGAVAAPEVVLAGLEALAEPLAAAGRHVHCLPVLQLQRVVARHYLKCQVGGAAAPCRPPPLMPLLSHAQPPLPPPCPCSSPMAANPAAPAPAAAAPMRPAAPLALRH